MKRSVLVAALAFGACEPSSPATQVTVILDADEGVRRDTTRIELEILGGPRDGELSPQYEETLSSPELPLELAIVPAGGDATRAFQAEAIARSRTGEMLGRVRARTGWLPNRNAVLHLRLEDCCRDVAETCDDDETCRDCECASAAIDPDTLPDYGSDAGAVATRDASTNDAAADASRSDDAGTDAGAPCENGPVVDTGIDVGQYDFDVVAHYGRIYVAYRAFVGDTIEVQAFNLDGAAVAGAHWTLRADAFGRDLTAATVDDTVVVAWTASSALQLGWIDPASSTPQVHSVTGTGDAFGPTMRGVAPSTVAVTRQRTGSSSLVVVERGASVPLSIVALGNVYAPPIPLAFDPVGSRIVTGALDPTSSDEQLRYLATTGNPTSAPAPVQWSDGELAADGPSVLLARYDSGDLIVSRVRDDGSPLAATRLSSSVMTHHDLAGDAGLYLHAQTNVEVSDEQWSVGLVWVDGTGGGTPVVTRTTYDLLSAEARNFSHAHAFFDGARYGIALASRVATTNRLFLTTVCPP